MNDFQKQYYTYTIECYSAWEKVKYCSLLDEIERRQAKLNQSERQR